MSRVTSAVYLTVATWQLAVAAVTSLGSDWRLLGNQPGVVGKWGCWDVGVRVTVQQERGVCVCTVVC